MVAGVDQWAVALDPSEGAGLRTQLERRLRGAVRDGTLAPGARLPSTRALAARLAVSRGVVVEAYAQLTADGYLQSRQGAATRVAEAGARTQSEAAAVPTGPSLPYDFGMGVPDVAAFPRALWLAATRRVLRDLPDARLGHPDPRGAPELRTVLAEHVGRVRGVATSPGHVLVTTGFSQALALTCRALHELGVRRLAMEDPSFVLHRWIAERADLEAVPIEVDTSGLRTDALAASGAGAVLVTPAHQMPTGAVLAPERRTALIAWAREHDAIVIEDDYDAEFRFDREPVGALQGLAPDLVVYGGSASKTLAPALRLGWLAMPARLADPLRLGKLLADTGSPGLEQLVLADLLHNGHYDRHVRRMRAAYRRRRDAFVAAVARELPGAHVGGIPAGLHALLTLPDGTDEDGLVARAREHGVAVEACRHHRFDPAAGPPALMICFARLSEPAITEGVRRLGRALGQAAP